MRYRLRTLLILLAVGPPVLAGIWICSSGMDFGYRVVAVAQLPLLVAVFAAVCFGRST